jgi:hypothetical protein
MASAVNLVSILLQPQAAAQTIDDILFFIIKFHGHIGQPLNEDTVPAVTEALQDIAGASNCREDQLGPELAPPARYFSFSD